MTPGQRQQAAEHSGRSMGVPAPVLLYDGICGVCNSAVRTILRLDRHGTPCNHAIGSYPLGPAILFRGSVCPAVLSLPSFHGFLTMAWPERNPWVLSPRPVPLSSLTLRPRVHVAMESRSAISASTPRVRSSGVNAWTARFSGACLADGPAKTDRSCRAPIRERPNGESPGRHECIRVRGHFSASGAPVAGRLDIP